MALQLPAQSSEHVTASTSHSKSCLSLLPIETNPFQTDVTLTTSPSLLSSQAQDALSSSLIP